MKRSYYFVLLPIFISIWRLNLCAQQNPDLIGTTYGAIQSSGSTGNRIAVDSDGGVHVTWMNYLAYPGQRAIYFNYRHNNDYWLGPTMISLVNGAGYSQIGLMDDNAAITYHSTGNPNIEDYVVYAEDQFTGFGIFQYFDPPDLIQYRCFWPKLSIDNSNFIHIIATENPPNAGDPQIIGHTYSTDGGWTWSKMVPIDTVNTVSAILVSSPVSEKVTSVYCHPIDLDNQRKNDVSFRQIKFDPDFINYSSQPVNVTEYGQNGDSLFAFDQLDAIYDYNDNLHIIWSAFWVTDQGVNPNMFLYHYDLDSGLITQMNTITWPPDSSCLIPEGNYPICNMSMSIIDNYLQALIATYTMFNQNDCSAAGYANGDVYFQISIDEGQNWHQPINITHTHTNNCVSGDCHSEVWPSSADMITNGDWLHISFIDDRSGGNVIMTNSVYYLKYDLWPVGIKDCCDVSPDALALLHAYPNPFNARTTIEFTLPAPSDVELTIYDITGAKVQTFERPGLEAGQHSFIWDAKKAASSVYFARLEAGEKSNGIKLILLK